MDKDAVKAKLREMEPALKAAGIIHLRLHGSVVRGEATTDSDVDVAAQFDKTKRLPLIDLVGLQNMISDVLGMEADLCDADRLKEELQSDFDREAELVFSNPRPIPSRHFNLHPPDRGVHCRRFV